MLAKHYTQVDCIVAEVPPVIDPFLVASIYVMLSYSLT
jgi:hypothetical protein